MLSLPKMKKAYPKAGRHLRLSGMGMNLEQTLFLFLFQRVRQTLCAVARVKETLEQEAFEGLEKLVDYLQVPHIHYLRGYEEGTPGALMMSRIVAKQLAGLGWTKEKIRNYVWERSAIPKASVERTGLKQWIEADTHPDTKASVNLDPWPICRNRKT